MRAKRTDDNQSAIVEVLRSCGVSVQSLAGVGKGCPDIACGFRGRNYLFEIKNGKQKPSAQKLTKDEQHFASSWKGQLHAITSPIEALKIMDVDGFKIINAELIGNESTKETFRA